MDHHQIWLLKDMKPLTMKIMKNEMKLSKLWLLSTQPRSTIIIHTSTKLAAESLSTYSLIQCQATTVHMTARSNTGVLARRCGVYTAALAMKQFFKNHVEATAFLKPAKLCYVGVSENSVPLNPMVNDHHYCIPIKWL